VDEQLRLRFDFIVPDDHSFPMLWAMPAFPLIARLRKAASRPLHWLSPHAPSLPSPPRAQARRALLRSAAHPPVEPCRDPPVALAPRGGRGAHRGAHCTARL
jgi:hypothetical protein